MSTHDVYKVYHEECAQVEQEYDEGKIDNETRVRYLKNLSNNLEMSLEPESYED